MAKTDEITCSGGFGDSFLKWVPTPMRGVFKSTPRDPSTEGVEGVTYSESGLFPAEQVRAHEELIEALADHLSECNDSAETCADISPAEQFFHGYALAIVLFVVALIVFTPLLLLFSSGPAAAVVATSTPIQRTEPIALGNQAPVRAHTPAAVVSTSGLPTPVMSTVTSTILSTKMVSSTASGEDTSKAKSSVHAGTVSPSATAALSKPLSKHQATSESVRSESSSVPPPVPPALIADRIKEMWSEANKLLQQSRCHEAEPLLAGALRLLEAHGSPMVNHRALASDQAFAMICQFRFEAGAQLLDRLVLNASSVHMNALGYARFMLKDYSRAGFAFAMGLRADPLNKIMWNNLAAARLLTGDIRAADDAMYRALDPDNSNFQSDPWFNSVFVSNVNVIAQHAMGQKTQIPSIEIWYDRIEY